MSSPSISALTPGISFSAAIDALTKTDIKPSRTPCFFSKASRHCSRNAIVRLMSISLKVVSIAAAFCAAFSRSAMRRRSRVIRTRTSRSPTTGGGEGIAGAGAGTVGGAGAGRANASITSALGDAVAGSGRRDRRGVEPALRHQLAHGRPRAFECRCFAVSDALGSVPSRAGGQLCVACCPSPCRCAGPSLSPRAGRGLG